MSLPFLSLCPWSCSSSSEAISWWFPWWSSSSSLYTYKHIFKYLFLLCLSRNHNVLYILFYILLFSLGNRSWSFFYISLDRTFLFFYTFCFLLVGWIIFHFMPESYLIWRIAFCYYKPCNNKYLGYMSFLL